MNDSVAVASVQFASEPPDAADENVARICDQIQRLADAGAQLVVFPELAISNFLVHGSDMGTSKARYWETATDLISGSKVQKIARCTREAGVYAVVGLAERGHLVGTIHNSAVLFGPTGVIGVTRKAHLPGLEGLCFTPGTEIPVFETPIGTIGIAICYDAWHPEYMRTLTVKGAEILVNINSVWKGGKGGGIGSPESKRRHWDLLPAVRSFENQVFVIACNGCGSHFMGESYGDWERMGLSKITDPLGTVLASADHDHEDVITATLRGRAILESRAAYPVLADRRAHLFGALGQPL